MPFLRFISKLAMLVLLFPLRVFPVQKNRVLLLNNILNFNAKYACSPKYLAEYILEHYPQSFEVVFPLGKEIDGSSLISRGITVVRLGTLKYYYYVLTSKFFITTSGAISYIPFRKSQVVINTWHGGGAYKKMGIDTSDSFFYRQDCKITASKTSYFLSSNKYFSDIVERSLLIDRNKILEIGLPRNDIFFTDYSDISSRIKIKYGIDPNAKIVMYAPTYRTPGENTFLTHQLGPYEIDSKSVIQALTTRFGGDWVFVLRLHPSIADQLQDIPENVIDMSGHDDIQELMCTADVLINDYSSTMWDFVQTRKPCFIFASDLKDYETNRGLYTKPSSWPFPLSTTNEELAQNILRFDEDKYAQDVAYYFKWMQNFEDGHACEKVCKLMLDRMMKEEQK
ncbi:CDP-glycerol glycerophosphotransferase family protein [Christensenellaceae bacterium NSJ-53]|uniref:CDP-glycerol glycerophosphotransferase family protein n=1 Tax=Gehongia tenuis TaxID=2763655 RepID=A0A926D6Q7_9FIRM|nr:CDP-glycerol glycerophosphotransferase family protein [Gehongia tenuis]